MKNLFDSFEAWRAKRKIEGFKISIDNYLSDNSQRLKNYEAHSVPKGFNPEAFKAIFHCELLVLDELSEMVVFRQQAIAVFKKYLGDEFGESRMSFAEVKAKAPYQEQHFPLYKSRFFWIYDEEYYISLGVDSEFGYYDKRFFETNVCSASDDFDAIPVTLCYWGESSMPMHCLTRKCYILLDYISKHRDVRIKQLWQDSPSGESVLIMDCINPHLGNVLEDMEYYEKNSEVNF